MILDNVADIGDNYDMSTKQHTTDLAATIRQAIIKSGMTPYRIAADAGVDRAILSRLLHGERGMVLETASKVCGVLGLELRPIKRRKGR